MNRDESMERTARIQEWIGAQAPVLLPPFKKHFQELLAPDGNDSHPALFSERLMQEFSLLSAEAFQADSYLKAMEPLMIRLENAGGKIRSGPFTLSLERYQPGELFACDVPSGSELSAEEAGNSLMVPRIGCFDKEVKFLSVFEDVIPWMSICPSEINSLKAPIQHAKRFLKQRAGQFSDLRILVLGLGLGYFPFQLLHEKAVEEIVIVEYSQQIIDLFSAYLLPCFPHPEKIRIVQGDAFEYLRHVRPRPLPDPRQGQLSETPSGPTGSLENMADQTDSWEFDYVFADTWESQFDGAKDYLRIKRQEKRLDSAEGLTVGFSYWIEPQIRAYLKDLGLDIDLD